jgi:hypothetical protein
VLAQTSVPSLAQSAPSRSRLSKRLGAGGVQQGAQSTQRGKPQTKENQKAKGKNQKSKISAPGRGPDWGGIFWGWPQSKQSSMTQSSMTQFLTSAGNWTPRRIFAAREEMGL